MRIEVNEWPVAVLEQYAAIPIAFEVNSVFDIASAGDNFTLSERHLSQTYVKDYDTIKEDHPLQWVTRYDVSDWGVLIAEGEGQWLGGAVIAFNTPELRLFESRTDVALLWDIRVRPHARRQGVGSVLIRSVEAWALSRGCRQLKIETQNINVAACRFYAHQGYVLTTVNPDAYPELPDEIQLVWCKSLVPTKVHLQKG